MCADSTCNHSHALYLFDLLSHCRLRTQMPALPSSAAMHASLAPTRITQLASLRTDKLR